LASERRIKRSYVTRRYLKTEVLRFIEPLEGRFTLTHRMADFANR